MPDEKNISPRIANAQGLKATRLLPKIPKTPSTSPVIPAITSMIANVLIIIYVFDLPQ